MLRTARLLLFCAATPLLAQVPADDQTAPLYVPLSTIYGDMQSAADVPVTMRDGTVISVDIYRPGDNRRHPTLYAAGPYPHTQGILADTTAQVGPIAWYVSHGYAVVVANVRGTGTSGGDFAFFSRDEQQDHYEIIEWIAKQSWSDGQVAGTGAGYYAASQWQMAIQNPPHLSCIAPINGSTDPFRDLVSPGGLANSAFINDWYDNRVRLPNAYTPGVNRLVNFDMRLAQLTHPVYDDYWQGRSSLNSTRLINVPVFAINDWDIGPTAPGVAGTVNALAALNVTNKLLIANPDTSLPLQQDTAFLARELLPFYEWCFNGRSAASPYVALPRIRFQVRGQNTIKRESTWPPGNIAQQAWFLNNGATSTGPGSLDPQQQTGSVGFSAWERRDTAAKLTFVSPALEQDMEIAGPIMLELYTASSAADMAFQITLKEELVYTTLTPGPLLPGFLAPAGPEPESPSQASTRITVSQGSLKASYRTRAQGNGSEYGPVYSMAAREQLVPGQVYRLDIALRQTAYRFNAGNRLVLEIAPVNDGSLINLSGRDTLQHNRQYPARLWLPVVQNPNLSSQRQAQPARAETPVEVNMEVPDLRILTPEVLDAINGSPDSPVIFVPR